MQTCTTLVGFNISDKFENHCVKLCNAISKETIKIFHSHFCLNLCASFKERKGFAETQVVKLWLKIH